MTQPQAAQRDKFAILVALILPTLITLLYFVLFPGASKLLYAPLKILQFSWPLIWIYGVRKGWRHPWQPARISAEKSGTTGMAFGLLVVVVGGLLFHFWLVPSGFFDSAIDAIKTKVKDTGLNSPLAFMGAGIFYSLCHSLLEEYYWRWFVYRECRAHWSLGLAIAISSLGFMAHHVFVLAEFFGWQSPVTYLFSLAVAIGGVFWAWLYERYGTLFGPWLSHLFVDAGIFAIGYLLVFGK